MNFKAFIHGYGSIVFASFIPAELTDFSLNGSKVFSATGKYGQIMIQEIGTPEHIVLYTLFKCEETVTVNISLEEPGIRVQMALEGNFDLRFEGLQRLLLKQNHVNMYYSPYVNGTGLFRKGHIYIMLDVAYNVDKLSELRRYFPILVPFLEKIEKDVPALLTGGINITKEMWQIIGNIIHYNYEPELLPVFTDHYFHSFLLLLLREASKPEQAPDMHHIEMEKIYRAEEMITKDLSHAPDIDRIAMEVGISRSVLGRIFKELFGHPPIRYWRLVGLRKAADLLKNTDLPIHEIAVMVGYKEASSFSKFFKIEFKMKPADWRRV